jgi:hypothetical protein
MELSESLKAKLKANWGIPCETMECFAEARVCDSRSEWESYLLALSDDEETLALLTLGVIEYVPTDQIMHIFNTWGEFVKFDASFRRRQAKVLYKKMNEGSWIKET